MAYDLGATEAYIRQAAQRRGIDPDTAVRVARSEGLARGTWQSNVRHPSRGREPSYGPFQLLVGGQNGWPTGMGNDFVRKTGLDPSDPANVNATIDFALDGAAQNGWGAWYGAAKVGVGNRDGIGGARPVNSYAEGPAPKGGASSAIQSVLADRSTSGSPSSPSPSSAGEAMSSRPMINIGPRRSNKLAEAMIDRAHANSGNIISPMQLWGSLAQVFAGNQQIRENEANEASALQHAMAGANLDPAYALAAQLGGDRESLAGAIMSQQSDRTQAAQRSEDQAWRQQQFEYQAGQDRIANERAGAALDLQRQNAERGNVPSGYRATATGLEPIPGGPADPAMESGGGTEYGLTPQYGVDAQGNPVVIQLGKDGTSIQTPLPEGVALSREPIRLDAGTHFVLLDPVTRQPIGQVPKENYQAGYESAAGTAQGKTDVERANDAPKSVQQADNMIASIDGVLNDPNLSMAVGVGSMIPAIPGTSIPGTRARIEQLGGQAFLQAFESLKGGGQITEIEGQKATQAIARLNTAQSEEDFRAALTELRGIVEGAKLRAQSVQAPQPGGQQFDASGVPVGGGAMPDFGSMSDEELQRLINGQ